MIILTLKKIQNVRRQEPPKEASMIKSCYPVFSRGDADRRLMCLPLGDRWVNFFFIQLHALQGL